MGLFKELLSQRALHKHLREKPRNQRLNDRLLGFMRRPVLLSDSTLSVIVNEYRNSLPIWGSTDCPYVPGYHKDILLNALVYTMSSHNDRVSYSLAEVLSDSGYAIEVANLARERNNLKVANVVRDMSKLRRDIVRENSILVKDESGRAPYATERALSYFEKVYLTVQEILKPLLPATH